MSTISVELSCDNFIDLQFDFENDTAVKSKDEKNSSRYNSSNKGLSPRE
jgi:hypothetical protein